MHKKIFYLFWFFLVYSKYDWTVVGAGPAGISAITVLLESGVSKDKILWIDPSFKVGNLSSYPEVPANSPASDFVDFFKSSKYFDSSEFLCKKLIENNSEPFLKDVISPLQCITYSLRKIVCSKEAYVNELKKFDNWQLILNGSEVVESKQVILATGSHPIDFGYNKDKTIPLEIALNKDVLKSYVDNKSQVIVFGGSHSAILVLKFLHEIGVKKIINIYKDELTFCDYSTNPPTNAGSGLKGIAARWAQDFLVGSKIENLERIHLDNLTQDLIDSSDKIVYAAGFRPNKINGIKIDKYEAGELAEGLFGMGIAFPDYYIDPKGNKEYLIGLDSFLLYARKTIPGLIKRQIIFSERYLDLEKYIYFYFL